MSVPLSFKCPKDFFTECVDFLQTYQWLYNYSNTDILAKDVFSLWPVEWIEYFRKLTNEELNDLPLGKVKPEKCPGSFNQFLHTLKKLGPNVDTVVPDRICTDKQNEKLSMKKWHEINNLAPIVHELCDKHNLNVLVDVGSGLGYLPHLLNKTYYYSILGVESSAERIKQAYQAQQKCYPRSMNNVVFVEHYIDQYSKKFIEESLTNCFNLQGETSFCMVGLHACADLSVTILKLFMDMDQCKGLIIMPCCYHRLKLRDNNHEKDIFENFPISETFKQVFRQFNAEYFLRVPFLRLACQQTIGSFIKMSEECHSSHSRNFMYRAILEAVVVEGGWKVQRRKRKSTKSSLSHSDKHFNYYLENLRKSHKLMDETGIEITDDIYERNFLRKMYEKWNQHKSDCILMEVVTGLQASLQSICENLVLLDRVEFLKENGFHCSLRKVTNDLLSPRCFALVATKSS